MAASAALRAAPATCISATSTPRRKPNPSPQKQAGKDISTFFFANLLTACDLSAAMARLFTAVAQGQIKPKVASTLAYLSQTMLQSIPIAQHEYCEAFGTEPWRRAVRSSFTPSAPAPNPAPKPPASAAPSPTPVEAGLQPGSSASSTSPVAPQPPVNCHSERSEEPAAASPSSNSSLATHHSPPPQAPQPAPSPHTPLPPTSTEFVQQVLAGRNSSRSEIPTLPGPGRETGSSGSSSSSAPSSASSSSDSAPARASSTQPAPSSARTLPTPDNSQPAPTPPAPPPAPPGFGAPANWDVLIPPKPRRRFSRHWQLLE